MSRKNDRSFCFQKSNPSHPSNHSEQSFFREVFFNRASNHFTAIILAGENFQRQHEKSIISVKTVFPLTKPQRQFSLEFSFTVQVLFFPTQYTESVCSPHTFFVCTHPTAPRPRLSVENPRSERAVYREGRSNLKAGAPPFISMVFERVARGGGRGDFCRATIGGRGLDAHYKYPSMVVLFSRGTQDSPEQW